METETRVLCMRTGLTFPRDTSPRNRASQEPDDDRQELFLPAMETESQPENAQAACGFKCLASKRTSFFQMINVIAAIFLAKVRRAIVGFLPLANKPS